MDRIVIRNNIIDNYSDKEIVISNNKISFLKNGDYTLEYIDSNSINLDIIIKSNIEVKLFIISIDNKISVNNKYSLGDNSKLDIYKFYYNDNIDEDIAINLDGEKAVLNYYFSSISKGREEYHIIVNHNNNKVISKISNKCIGLDNSRISLEIDSALDKGNIDCVMDQTSKILTIGEVEATIRPNMFIDEDSVEARHGSVVGKITEEDIFYLMSRGITERDAIDLYIKGYIFSNLDVDMEKRAMIFQVIQSLRG